MYAGAYPLSSLKMKPISRYVNDKQLLEEVRYDYKTNEFAARWTSQVGDTERTYDVQITSKRGSRPDFDAFMLKHRAIAQERFERYESYERSHDFY